MGEFYEDNCDILINWITPNINDGPACYKQLVEKAGEQFHYNLIGFKNQIKPADTFTTHAGFLPATIAINCVMPPTKAMYNDCFYRIKESIKTYHSLDNLSRYVTLTIPDISYQEFVYYLNSYLQELKFVKEFRFIVNTEKNYIGVNNELKKYHKEKKHFLNKLYKIFQKK